MRMGCAIDQIPGTDSWKPHAIISRPLDSFLCGSLAIHEGIDRLGAYKGVIGWVDGLGVALKTHEGSLTIGDSEERRVTLYLSEQIPDEETEAECIDLVKGAFGLQESDMIRFKPAPVRKVQPLQKWPWPRSRAPKGARR